MFARQKESFFQAMVIVLILGLIGASAVGAQERLAKEQVLQVALDSGDARTFMPHFAGSSTDRVPADMIHNGLLRYPPGNQVNLEPDLATSWEVSKDKKTWIFHLRKGVFFHPFPGYPSGYELTSEDVVYSLKRSANPAFSAYSVDYSGISFEAVDRYTVKVITVKPMSETLFLAKFANESGGFIVCKKAIEEKGEEWVKTNPIGTGPFIFKSYDPRQKTVLVQNKNYFRGVPILTEVVLRYMPSISSRELGIQTGELHMIEGIMEEKWVEKMNSFADIKAKPYGPTEANMLHINITKAPFNDVRVRKAVAYAISRKQIAAFMGDSIAVPIYSAALAPPAIGALTKEEALKAGVVYEDDIKKAKELLAEAGYPNGFKTEAIISEMASDYRKPMIAIQAQLKKAGIDLDLKVVDHPSFHSLIRKDASPFVLYSPWRPNVDVWLTRFFHSDAIIMTGKKPDTNFSHYAGIDDLIEKARWELDPERQIALWKEAQIKVLRDVAVVPIMRLKYVFAMKSYVEPGHPNNWLWTTQACQITEKTRILAH